MLTDESKILITGTSGKLGKACKKIMPQTQFSTRNEIDLQDLNSIKNYFKKNKVETIIHLAAMTGIPPCEENQKKAYDINVNGTRKLIKVALDNGVKHFIYVSTACVFPGTNSDTMEDEDGIPYPKHFYGLTKLLAEEIVKSFNSDKIKTTVVRTNFTSMPWKYPKAFTDRYGTYLFAQGVAKGLKDVAIFKPNNSIIHICGNKKISMYEYAKLGGSNVSPINLSEYNGPPLTKNMCLTSKYWKLYNLEDSDYNEE